MQLAEHPPSEVEGVKIKLTKVGSPWQLNSLVEQEAWEEFSIERVGKK
jgi:hypothetical protein